MIVKYPNKILSQKCQKVTEVDEDVLKVIDKLKSSLIDASNGVGLAAPQVGENLSIFAIRDHSNENIQIYINPQIMVALDKEKIYPQVYTEEGEREEFYEGCLSFPKFYGTVKRWMEIKVKYQVINKKNKLETKKDKLTGMMAIVFQHELDHLEGVLFIDRINEEEGSIFKEDGGKLNEIDVEKVSSNK